MKKDRINPGYPGHYLSVFIILLVSSIISCNDGEKVDYSKVKPWTDYCDSNNYGNPNYGAYKELVIYRKPGSSDEDFARKLDSINNLTGGGLKVSLICKSCDSSLLLLTGPAVETYIMSDPVAGGVTDARKGGGPSGDDGPLYYSVNFDVTFNDVVDTLNPNYQGPGLKSATYTRPAVTVAVFDTGVDTTFVEKFLTTSNIASCLDPTAGKGWNFVLSNNQWEDDNPHQHGTNVTGFVIDKAANLALDSVRILPVKIHDKDGKSDLFSVLCGFAYAAKQHVDIINASFGFYTRKIPIDSLESNRAVKLMREYIKNYLTANNILLVAAAGNVLPDNTTRNLDSVSFYPASFAQDPELPNVIAVTTVDTNSGHVSKFQNFSPQVVDIGVSADFIQGDIFAFKNPRQRDKTANGSSFATPIATGMIAANWYLLPAAPGTNSGRKLANKNAIIAMLKQGNFAFQDHSFDKTIKNGTILRK